jgi:hypothetical protein
MIITYHKIKDKVRPFFTLTLIIMNSYIYIYVIMSYMHVFLIWTLFMIRENHDTFNAWKSLIEYF